MSLRRHQLAATAAALPGMVFLTPLASIGLTAALVVLAVSSPASLVLHARVAGAAVAAASAGLLDDPASATLASSPAPLLVRRSFRFVAIGVVLAGWWVVMIGIVEVRGGGLPLVETTRELVLLAAIASVGAILVQRGSGEGDGRAGGLLALAWFAVSFLPLPGWLLPPDALDPGGGPVLTLAVLLAVAAAVGLSRDPLAARPLGLLRSRRE
jgi:hypothetical protein